MGRARGANATLAGAFSTAGYGTTPTTGFRRLPFVSSNLGEEQGLIDSDLLGFGRDPQEPGDDVINNDGTLVVPVDLRNFGWWLKALFGAPTTATGIPASGAISFSDQPVTNATLTLNGTLITLVTGAPTGSQVKIGATLAETVANLVTFLNASADTGIVDARYAASLDGAGVTITAVALGTAGNSYTLAKGSTPALNATLSGATLTGGATSGASRHTFTAGGQDQPDAAIEVGMPDVPHFGMNFGVLANSLSIQMQRSGLLNASLELIAQGERTGAATTTGSLETAWPVERFSQFTGAINRDGLPLGKVESATLRISNNLEKDESIRPDGRIGGADGGMVAATVEITARFADRSWFDLATNRTPVSLDLGWTAGPNKTLNFRMPRVRLPRPKAPVTGPNGVRVTLSAQVVEHPTLGWAVQAVLVNDVAAY